MPICPFRKQPKVEGGVVIKSASPANAERCLLSPFYGFLSSKNVQYCFTTNHRGSDRVVFQINHLSSSQVVSIV